MRAWPGDPMEGAVSAPSSATALEIEEQKQLGVTARNDRYRGYEEVSKPTYNLAEQQGGGAVSETVIDGYEFDTVDFALWRGATAAGRAAFAARLGAALQRDGFAILVNHGCGDGEGEGEGEGAAASSYDAAQQRVEQLFLALTPEQRARFAAQRHGAVNQGFFAIKKTSNIHPDLVEGWVWCRRAFGADSLGGGGGGGGGGDGGGDDGGGGGGGDGGGGDGGGGCGGDGGCGDDDDAERVGQFWPGGAEQEAFFGSLVAPHLQLAAPLAEAILTHLGVDFLAAGEPGQRVLAALHPRPPFALRLNYYPPLLPPSTSAGAGAVAADGGAGLAADADAGAGRMLGHEDMDLFTLLPAPSQDGLQVLLTPQRAMELVELAAAARGESGAAPPAAAGHTTWARLRAPPGSIIVNTGDYLQRLSNDVLRSTTHRVAVPHDPALRRRARISFPMAIYLPETDTLDVLPGLGPPKYPPIGVLDFHTRVMSKYYGENYRSTGTDGVAATAEG